MARVMRVVFEANPPDPVLIDIEDPASFMEVDDHSFKFGKLGPTLFSWGSGDVTMHGTPEPGSDWRVGFLQLIKDYWLNVWWGADEQAQDKARCSGCYHCGGGWIALNGKDAGSAKPLETIWYNDYSVTEPYTADGETRSTPYPAADSPGSSKMPYCHKNVPGKAQGRFNFGSTFFSYLVAFNSKSTAPGDSPDRIQYLNYVYWQTMLAGTFNKNRATRLEVTNGGKTERGAVGEGYPSGYHPVLFSAPASDSFFPQILGCYDPNKKCD